MERKYHPNGIVKAEGVAGIKALSPRNLAK